MSTIENFYKGYNSKTQLNKKDSVNNLRRVVINTFSGLLRYGWFHTWSNVADGQGESNPCAIVEFEDGRCSIIFDIERIRFIDTYHANKEKSSIEDE